MYPSIVHQNVFVFTLYSAEDTFRHYLICKTLFDTVWSVALEMRAANLLVSASPMDARGSQRPWSDDHGGLPAGGREQARYAAQWRAGLQSGIWNVGMEPLQTSAV